MADEAHTDPLATIRARAAQLEREIDEAPDEATARSKADELHALMDDVENVSELRPEHRRAAR
jgi:hypothetical protein